MMLSVVLIEGQNVREDALRSVSLGNAKQLVIGNAYGFGVLLHIAADRRRTWATPSRPLPKSQALPAY